MKPKLRIVESEAMPETALRLLFLSEAEVLAELAEIRARIAAERRAYADRHGLITPPRIERLRGMLGPRRVGDALR